MLNFICGIEKRLSHAVRSAVILGLSGGLAAGSGTQSWTFDETTEGEDVFWTSPTAVDPDAALYDAFYEVQLVEVMVEWQGIPYGPVDVTDELDEDDQSGEEEAEGPAPVVLFDEAVVAPPPPDDPSFAADILVGLDASGFGYVEATDVYLGEAVVDLGSPIGEQTVQITSVRLVVDIAVTPYDETLPGDLTGDGTVSGADLGILLSEWGACDDCGDCPADLTGDCEVGGADLGVLLSNWTG